jgi:GNAT superfamily N-acetyltransferase
MERVNEPGGAPACRFFLGRSASGNVWSVGAAVPDDLAGELDEFGRAEPVTADWREPPRCREAVVARLGSAEREWRGPAYLVPDDASANGRTIVVDRAGAAVLVGEFGWLSAELDEWAPCAAVVEDGRAVSVCFSSRVGSRACEAGVETLPTFRGRGLAGQAVARWAAEVRRRGKVALYSTSWEHRASRRVAEKLGMRLYGEDWHVG